MRDTGMVIGSSATATALTMAFVLIATPVDACHRFHVWRYPYPQRCGVAAPTPVQAPQDRSWYVEITDAAPSSPLETDLRTPDQIRDFDEHYIELAKHHDEINRMMVILHTEEDAARAAGLRE